MNNERLSNEEIELINKFFLNEFNNQGTSFSESYYTDEHKIKREMFQSLFNEMCSKLDKYELNLATIKESGVGKHHIVRFPDRHKVQKFIDSGGFVNYYKDYYTKEDESIKDEIATRKKLHNESVMSGWKLNTYWYVFGIAVISVLINLYTFVTSINNNSKEEISKQRTTERELEQSKSHTLPLDQRNPNPLHLDKIDTVPENTLIIDSSNNNLKVKIDSNKAGLK